MQEPLPHKKPGDLLSADHINRLNVIANRMGGKSPSRGSSGVHASTIFSETSETRFQQYQLEITNLQIDADDTDDSGLYLAKRLFYSYTDEEWQLDGAEWVVDARATYLRFEARDENVTPVKQGHRITAYWDEQRGTFIPVSRVWPSQERKVKLTQTITAGSSGTANVWENGIVTSPLQTYTVWLNWMHGGEGAASGVEAIARWFDDERKWVIVNVEC